MKRRRDTASLIVGLAFVLIAGLGLWSAFGVVDWSLMKVIVPVCLVTVGLIGLAASRNPR